MKMFTLFKKSPEKADSPWYFRFQFRGERMKRSLDTTDKREAETRARAMYRELTEATLKGDRSALDSLRLREPPSATLLEVLDAYEKDSYVIAENKARRNNRTSLLLLCRRCGLGDDPAAIRVRALNGTTARAWFGEASARIRATNDQDEKARIRRTTVSTFNQANSVFCALALDFYKSKGLYCESMEDFSRTGRMLKRTLEAANKGSETYRAAPDEVVERTLLAWRDLDDRSLFDAIARGAGADAAFDYREVTAKEVFLAAGLTLAFGLRRGEVTQAKWGWLTTGPGYPVLNGRAFVKKGTGSLCVRALDPWFTLLRDRVAANGWAGGPDELILPGNGTKSYYADKLFRAVGAWMRGLGWETEKTTHALRDYAGSQVVMKYGPWEGQGWLRHESVETTQEYYCDYVKAFRPADLDELPARWAELKPAAAPASAARRDSAPAPAWRN